MSAAGRKKAKADAIARLNALWLPVASRIILIGSRIITQEAEPIVISTCSLPTDISGSFLVAGDDIIFALGKSWLVVFGTVSELPPLKLCRE